jgi:hypothetical protein
MGATAGDVAVGLISGLGWDMQSICQTDSPPPGAFWALK